MDVAIGPTTDANYSQKLIQENMAPYYEARKIAWNPQMFMESWRVFDNYEIRHERKRCGVIRLKADGETLFIRDLQIEPSEQRQGIGREAINWAVAYAQTSGYAHLALRVFAENPAVSLYQALGFVETGRSRDAVLTLSLPLTATSE
ncbi:MULTISPECIES: N-acetyltransferase [unclassified Salinivibrio]|uniref:GNAT family N-acetyltransferase n=1 Tax=unclassified Salinivibrio TaxID=2636825 RepID=UPI00128D1555|nr:MULTISPECIES: GNAT family N-acetyltransferase [unclassified Salinivibrio]MPS31722.1 GNAT family N-acetyltransferase [Salinivibrio sp. VYel7]MPX90292.1 GNAT family N-acetyltransferase [Salinivibrio sp. VYel1]MPX93116.1 GNAT family N-acetyltransferase [Salinivibrio sp. VYel9]MPX95200.1 GNAT family N-acetyltransferase [Salinivibrio sp. VYel6]MPX99334.1 GNAT family N-acetyltransferase [Salinivibrio sp. VYel4]